MSRRLRALLRRSDGSAAVEFAFAIPVLLSMIFGMFQLGIVFQANAGMQHALGEAARRATVCVMTDSVCGPPPDTEIQAYITNERFGTGTGTWGEPQIDNSVAGQKTITVNYTQPLDWIFFTSTVNLTESKVVYLSD